MTPAMQDFNGVQGKQYGTCLAAMTLCFVELPMWVSVWGLRKGSLTLKKTNKPGSDVLAKEFGLCS